jgi:hypothetical protein
MVIGMKPNSQPQTPKSKRSRFNKNTEKKKKPTKDHPRPGKKIQANKLTLKRTHSTLTSGIDERLVVTSSADDIPAYLNTKAKTNIENTSLYSKSPKSSKQSSRPTSGISGSGKPSSNENIGGSIPTKKSLFNVKFLALKE